MKHERDRQGGAGGAGARPGRRHLESSVLDWDNVPVSPRSNPKFQVCARCCFFGGSWAAFENHLIDTTSYLSQVDSVFVLLSLAHTQLAPRL